MASEATGKFQIYRVLAPDKCRAHLVAIGYARVKPAESHADLELYVLGRKVTTPRWIRVLGTLAASSEDISNLVNVTASFALLMPSGANTYAVCGGFGSSDIQGFIQPDFGLDVVARVVKPDDVKLKRQKGVAGAVAHVAEMYRGAYNFQLDASNWGKLTKEIMGEASRADLQKVFGLELGGRRKLRLHGKSAFSLNRSLAIPDLRKLVSTFDSVLSQEAKLNILRGYEEVTDKQRKADLGQRLIDQLVAQYAEHGTNPDQWQETNIGLSSADLSDLLLSVSYTISMGGHQAELEELQLKDVFGFLRDTGCETFAKSHLDRVRISGKDADDGEVFDASLRQLVYAEIRGSLYFFIDARWFSVKTEFADEIEVAFDQILAASTAEIATFALPPWSKIDNRPVEEDDFIAVVCNGTDLLKFHKDHVIIHGLDKAELCDILDLRNGSAGLLYVKMGIGTKLRELFAQARGSALLYARHQEFRQKAHGKINAKLNSVPDSLKTPGVVLVFTDHSPNRQAKSLKERLSTIVKIDLVDTVRYLKQQAECKFVGVYEVRHA